MTPLATEYVGERGVLFRLALKASVLTVLTLGIYRFWMKTRLRRYYWSAIRPGGAPLEYTGQPLEKLLGFLVAVVVMAFYIGVVNLILMFFSFALFQGNVTAYALSFIGVLPIIFFAQYRARRYILARTRWRGIRFGLEPGAWGYAWRAMFYWALAIATLGLLYPLKAFRLEKYLIDRTHFGSMTFQQGGRWTMLYGPLKHAFYAIAVLAVSIGAAVLSDNETWLALAVLAAPWAGFAGAYWRAHSWRLLTDHKELGEVRFRSTPRAGRVLGIWLLGGFLIYLSVLAIIFALLIGVVALLAASASVEMIEFLNNLEENFDTIPAWIFTLAGIGIYFSFFLLGSALSHTFITLPMAAHFASQTQILNPEALAGIDQRARDEFAEAEGFADALDVGAAL
ncbi:DUF898 family protein [Aliiroseovarius sp.]|uniref:DUF898 family protein n=1 Tax=Aliiroseovarius sp. TaxID=1872442 RepID=UPI00260FF982|nr:DUF898 family protein [Aliiroseovarius sp.]